MPCITKTFGIFRGSRVAISLTPRQSARHMGTKARLLCPAIGFSPFGLVSVTTVTRCEEAGGEAGGEDERDQEGQIAGYKGSHGGARCRGGNTVLLL